MKTLTTTEIRNAVLNLFDENGGNAAFMSGDDTNNELYDIIDTVVESAVHKIHLQAPSAMLDGKKIDNTQYIQTFLANGRYAIRFALPQDFFRIVSIRMNGWRAPITTLLYEDSVEYRKQGNKYLMGTEKKPIGFIVNSMAFGEKIQKCCELYSSEVDNGNLKYFGYYLPKPTLSAQGSIEVCDRLEWPCLYQIAADALKAVNEAQKAQIYEAMAERYFATFSNIERKTTEIGTRIEK